MNKALILDFGGVVTRTLFETHDVTERALGLAPGTLSWRGPFDIATDPLWASMQAREITERDYWQIRTREVGALLGEDWTEMKTFVRRARGAEPDLVLRPEARESIVKAKQAGIKLAILSNELDLFYGVEFRKRFPLIELFDVIVDATYTKVLKPDPRAYEQVLAELNIDRADCVFVDDQKKNIEGAEAVGLPHVHFDVTRPAEAYARALTMLGI
ncbi:HAD family hydrolase [Ochrobactrum sp. P6BS-III]|uniref:HAD family hydrolase n=1 Tax=unclassified Ochrobactrum TaxID=239106 RepID=UPI000991C69A|nr:putative hydrolase of the HAD superfamily [Ochrobactrum sp. P6BSIII]OOL15813.1 HAD family hydrolase [Ochrobactrum sp. P6BS-III]